MVIDSARDRTEGPKLGTRMRPIEISAWRIKIGRSCNPFVRHELRIETIAGTQRASQHWERSHKRLSVFNNDQFVFLTMKIKVRLARWLSLRIQEQTRKERRALRDYSRQELGRIRQAEIRSRGLRLYA
jgi:hypothetical protein